MSLRDPRQANQTTARYLMRPMKIEPPTKRMMPGLPSYRSYEERMRMGLDCDEVYPGIIIGEERRVQCWDIWNGAKIAMERVAYLFLQFFTGTGETVKNLKYLQNIGVTHVLNTSEGDVNINPNKYRKEGIIYWGFRCPDLPHSDISQFFDESVEFLDRALSFQTSLVFVNCLLGFSRSTAIVAAYLMKKKGMSASEALCQMRCSREVKPNIGFLEQLGRLDDELRAKRFRKCY